MPATYEPIATTTLSTAASTITFSSIPATYTDLRLVLVIKPTASCAVYVKLNNNSAVTYSFTQIAGNGTSATSSRGSDSAGFVLGANIAFQDTEMQMGTVDIFSYAGSTNKTALSSFISDLNGSGNVGYNVSLFPSTTAVSRLDLINQASTTFATGTTATLYGIKSA